MQLFIGLDKAAGKWCVNSCKEPNYKENWSWMGDFWLRYLGGKIPPDRKVKCEDITAPVNND